MSKQQYKAIISDFDGTLQGHLRSFPREIISPIQNFIKNGNTFTISTGRSYVGTIHDACDLIGLSGPQIVTGGAEIVDHTTNKVIWGNYFEVNTSEQIFQFLKARGIGFIIEKDTITYTESADKEKIVKIFGPDIDYRSHKDLTFEGIPKFLIISLLNEIDSKEEMDLIIKDLKSTIPDLQATPFQVRGRFGLDILPASVSKKGGVEKYLELLGLKKEEVIGMGDSYNDIPLLESCGYKIAVGNAVDDLKDIADYIAPPQSENGVLDVIEKFFL